MNSTVSDRKRQANRANLQFLQSLPDLSDPGAAEEAGPDLNAVAMDVLPSARDLPAPDLCETLIARLPRRVGPVFRIPHSRFAIISSGRST